MRTVKTNSANSFKAAPMKVLYGARGNIVPMRSGPCLWCGQWVEQGREIAGATNPYDPAWHNDGDFGCDESPESNDDGCGSHARPYDLARLIMGK